AHVLALRQLRVAGCQPASVGAPSPAPFLRPRSWAFNRNCLKIAAVFTRMHTASGLLFRRRRHERRRESFRSPQEEAADLDVGATGVGAVRSTRCLLLGAA